MDELKPCPFCGGEAILFTTLTGQKHFVECPECGAGFDQDYLWSDTKEQAKSKWNTRQPQGINWQPIDSFVIEENINKNILLLAKNKQLFYAPVTEDNLHSDGLVLIRNMEWGNFYSYESIKGITHWALIGDREVNQNAN